MFPALVLQWGKTTAAAPGANFGDIVQSLQTVSGSGTTTTPGAVIASGFSETYYVFGGPAAFTLFTDGTESSGTWNWFDPPTSGKGAIYWAELVALTGIGAMSGSPLGTRMQISGAPNWSLDASNRIRTFTLNIYDAASGGSLVSTGTIELDTTT